MHAVRGPGNRVRTRAAFSAEVAGPMRLGSRLVAYLCYAQHLPVARLRELHGLVLAIPMACMDETGLRVAGKSLWRHVIGDDTVTSYCLGPGDCI